MKNLNKNQWVAVFTALTFVAYLFFGSLVSFFSTEETAGARNTEMATVIVRDITVGTGAIVGPGDIITVHYTGRLENGQIFDSSQNRTPFSFVLGSGQVIRGWDEGLVGMRVGGKRVLIVPPEYGYGSSGAGPIPPNSTLIFEIDLLNAEKPQPIR